MNLAPLRYRRVLTRNGGPVRATEWVPIEVAGRRLFQANVFLEEKLRPIGPDNVIFGNPDGTGTASRPFVAEHKAISEALERWAHFATYASADASKYGFHADNSSNGMGAFPGLFARQARASALNEAAERQSIAGWWDGALDAEPVADAFPGVDTYRVENPVSHHAVALLHATAAEGVHIYAQGAASKFSDACWRAAVELARTRLVMARHAARTAAADAPAPTHFFERRLLHYSTPAGHEEFRERLARKKWRTLRPHLLFDGEIRGPWSRYAHVWRVAYAPVSDRFLDPANNFFFW